jgi:membrane-anchored glycerophosphoryl diester phosphodiesterase (GDPDase)|tara:strand:- start:397 stop:630 length:234 start_codon:yes stop_codon:yes gene_type:complete
VLYDLFLSTLCYSKRESEQSGERDERKKNSDGKSTKVKRDFRPFLSVCASLFFALLVLVFLVSSATDRGVQAKKASD